VWCGSFVSIGNSWRDVYNIKATMGDIYGVDSTAEEKNDFYYIRDSNPMYQPSDKQREIQKLLSGERIFFVVFRVKKNMAISQNYWSQFYMYGLLIYLPVINFF
jgi:hypothetical protein